jgi:hypothetical protein
MVTGPAAAFGWQPSTLASRTMAMSANNIERIAFIFFSF